MADPKHPNISVTLTDSDGNAIAVISKVSRALRKNGVSKEDIHSFRNEATSGDYNHVLKTCMSWVDVN